MSRWPGCSMTQPDTHAVRRLPQAWGQGDDAAREQIVPIVYKEAWE